MGTRSRIDRESRVAHGRFKIVDLVTAAGFGREFPGVWGSLVGQTFRWWAQGSVRWHSVMAGWLVAVGDENRDSNP